jgi:uncharacterized protein YbjT (DUF2867 family)
MTKITVRLLISLSLLFCAACTLVQPAAKPEVVLVAGATGRTGQHVVRQLLDDGYKVRALVRDRDSAFENLGPDVELIVGDVTMPDSLEPAFAGASKVISAIGSTTKEGPGSPEFIDYAGNNNLVDAAVAANVQQFVLVSSMGVTHEKHPLNKMMNNLLIWKFRSEEYLRNSGLSYTIIRPGGLHDKPAGEQLIVFEQADIIKITGISRADVAAVCVAAIQYPQAIDKTFEVFAVKEPPDNNWQAKFAALE